MKRTKKKNEPSQNADLSAPDPNVGTTPSAVDNVHHQSNQTVAKPLPENPAELSGLLEAAGQFISECQPLATSLASLHSDAITRSADLCPDEAKELHACFLDIKKMYFNVRASTHLLEPYLGGSGIEFESMGSQFKDLPSGSSIQKFQRFCSTIDPTFVDVVRKFISEVKALHKRIFKKLSDPRTRNSQNEPQQHYPQEDRDGWIYFLKYRGVKLKLIKKQLGELSEEIRGWDPIVSTTGISTAAKRYALFKGLPKPPTRRRSSRKPDPNEQQTQQPNSP